MYTYYRSKMPSVPGLQSSSKISVQDMKITECKIVFVHQVKVLEIDYDHVSPLHNNWILGKLLDLEIECSDKVNSFLSAKLEV